MQSGVAARISSENPCALYTHCGNHNMQVEDPHLLCPTRWTVRTKAIWAVLHSYEALYSTLLSIAKESSKSTVRDTASGMASQLKKFSTYFGLSFAQNIFSVCEQVVSTLQKPSITAQTSITCVNSLKTNLQRQQDDFHLFYDQVVTSSKAINFVDNPKL